MCVYMPDILQLSLSRPIIVITGHLGSSVALATWIHWFLNQTIIVFSVSVWYYRDCRPLEGFMTTTFTMESSKNTKSCSVLCGTEAQLNNQQPRGGVHPTKIVKSWQTRIHTRQLTIHTHTP